MREYELHPQPGGVIGRCGDESPDTWSIYVTKHQITPFWWSIGDAPMNVPSQDLILHNSQATSPGTASCSGLNFHINSNTPTEYIPCHKVFLVGSGTKVIPSRGILVDPGTYLVRSRLCTTFFLLKIKIKKQTTLSYDRRLCTLPSYSPKIPQDFG